MKIRNNFFKNCSLYLSCKLEPAVSLPQCFNCGSCFLCLSRTNNRLELRHKLEGHQLGVVSVDVNRQGTVAASSSLNSQIRLWDIETGKHLKMIDAGPGLYCDHIEFLIASSSIKTCKSMMSCLITLTYDAVC